MNSSLLTPPAFLSGLMLVPETLPRFLLCGSQAQCEVDGLFRTICKLWLLRANSDGVEGGGKAGRGPKHHGRDSGEREMLVTERGCREDTTET